MELVLLNFRYSLNPEVDVMESPNELTTMTKNVW